jgi:hypothetical protein
MQINTIAVEADIFSERLTRVVSEKSGELQSPDFGHSERSEESRPPSVSRYANEILRGAQNDCEMWHLPKKCDFAVLLSEKCPC